MCASMIAVAAVCLGTCSVSGCGQPSQACAVSDHGGGGTGGYQTPQHALQSVLAQHMQWLAPTGWKITGRGTHALSFASGNDSIGVVQDKAGKWSVGAVTACQ